MNDTLCMRVINFVAVIWFLFGFAVLNCAKRIVWLSLMPIF